MCTSLFEKSDFLNAIGNLFEAFPVHEKNKSYHRNIIDEAIMSRDTSKRVLKEVGVSIKLKQNVKKFLDSVEGFASFKTMQSVKLINWNFKRDCGNLKLYEYKTVNLLNCVTLDTEHFHASSQFKPPSLRYLEYARASGSIIKESLKRIFTMLYFQHASCYSWYPVSEKDMEFRNALKLELPPAKPKYVKLASTVC